MRRILLTFTLLIATLSWGCCCIHAQVLTPQHSPVEQLVVLKNGEILRGIITQDSANLTIETEHGSRLVVRQDRADFVCRTMDEAYWGKSARTRASDLAGQKSLFRWCLKHQLFEQAQNQIDLLMEMDIASADLEFFGRQFGVAVAQRKSNIQTAIARAKVIHENNTPVLPNSHLATTAAPIVFDPGIGQLEIGADVDTTVFRPLPSLMEETPANESRFAWSPPVDNSPTVRQVDFQEEQSYDTISLDHRESSQSNARPVGVSSPRDDRVMIPIAELEAEMKSLPKGTVSVFRRRVERVLINGCNAAKCHDSNSVVMPLMKVSRSQQNPVRFGQRNLHNVLKYIDRQNPENSLLFAAATSLHANQEKPILAENSRAYDNLKRWLISISDDPNGSFSGNGIVDQQPRPSLPDHLAQPLPGKPIITASQTREPSPSSIPSTIGAIPELDRNHSGYAPLDPFDPEIFNRQLRADQ